MARDYENYSKDALIVHIHELEKQLKNNKYGLHWDKSIEQESVIRKCKTNIPALTTLNMMCGNEGFVDVIYIDPPYNRGEEDFRYNDKFVDKEDGYKHSKDYSYSWHQDWRSIYGTGFPES